LWSVAPGLFLVILPTIIVCTILRLMLSKIQSPVATVADKCSDVVGCCIYYLVSGSTVPLTQNLYWINVNKSCGKIVFYIAIWCNLWTKIVESERWTVRNGLMNSTTLLPSNW
jgi:hypothetical protein